MWKKRLFLLACITVADVSMDMSDRHSGWILYLIAAAIWVLAIVQLMVTFHDEGFAAGVKSVPLDGAGLASGDDRSFDSRHRWNADLGAWEKQKGRTQ